MIIPSKVLVENNFVTLNVMQNRTYISCNYPILLVRVISNLIFLSSNMTFHFIILVKNEYESIFGSIFLHEFTTYFPTYELIN